MTFGETLREEEKDKDAHTDKDKDQDNSYLTNWKEAEIIVIIILISRGRWDISDCLLGPWPSYYSLDEKLDSIFPRGVFLPPQYCGVGTGQHMFINAFEGLDVSIKDPNSRLQDEKMIFQQVQATIDITIGSASAEGRKWSIRSP